MQPAQHAFVVVTAQPSHRPRALGLEGEAAARGEADARGPAQSFRVTQVRPSSLKPSTDNDYRYASRSLRGFSEGESEIDAALARDLSTQSGDLTGKFAGDSSVVGYAYQNAQVR